jgi:hypothetical protein
MIKLKISGDCIFKDFFFQKYEMVDFLVQEVSVAKKFKMVSEQERIIKKT